MHHLLASSGRRQLGLLTVTPTLYAGILFLCTLPSTVQSSIAFTAMAKGNVPAAVCSASASSIIGIFVTPLVVSLVLSSHVGLGSAWRGARVWLPDLRCCARVTLDAMISHPMRVPGGHGG